MSSQYNEEYYINLIILNAKVNSIHKDGFFNVTEYIDLYVLIINDLKEAGIILTLTDFYKILYYPDLLLFSTLIGMNKEKMEKNSNLVDYIKYFEIEENNYIEIIKNESKNTDINNIIKMIRNSFEHFEYEFSPQDFSLYVYNTGKSGKKYFEAKLDYKKFRSFIDKFYSNDLYTGISDHYTFISGNSDEISENSIFTFDRLVKYISKKIIIETNVIPVKDNIKINYSGHEKIMLDEFNSLSNHANGRRYNLDGYEEYISKKFSGNISVKTIGIREEDSVALAKYIIQQNSGFYLMSSTKKATTVYRTIRSFCDLETSFYQDSRLISSLDNIIRMFIFGKSNKDNKELLKFCKSFNQMRYKKGGLNYNYENSLSILYGYNLVNLIEDVGAENFGSLKVDKFKIISSNPKIEERLIYLKDRLEKRNVFLSPEKLYQTFILIRVRDAFAHGNIKLGLRKDIDNVTKPTLILKDKFNESETTLIINVKDFIYFCNEEQFKKKINKVDEMNKKI